MVDSPDGRHAPSHPASEARLDSWKEIAAYLGRGVRTVQRWEREEDLPVHRLSHEKRGTVYAIREELAAWWDRRRITLAATPVSDEADVPAAPHLDRVTRTSHGPWCYQTTSSASAQQRSKIATPKGGVDGRDCPHVVLFAHRSCSLCGHRARITRAGR
jgi:hypothetical protein